jgi:pimeloyl-ACP methyl ester carboxylesterase
MEEIKTFTNRRNERLFGILSLPPQKRQGGRGILLLNTGLNNRVAWHRLNVKLARAFSNSGYPVLRFDTHGVGDSEGELPAADIFKHYRAIESGRFVEDTIDAISHFVGWSGCDDVVLAGLCGGAITAMLTAARDRRVAGVVHIAGPVRFSDQRTDGENHPFSARDQLSLYLRKMVSVKGWLRLISGRSEYNAMAKIVRIFLGSAAQKFPQQDKKMPELNNGFINAFRNFCGRGGKALFIFAERDNNTWEFEKYFREKYLTDTSTYASQCVVQIIAKTNHIFSSDQSQEILREGIERWLSSDAVGVGIPPLLHDGDVYPAACTGRRVRESDLEVTV